MKTHAPWMPLQDEVVRRHYKLSDAELQALVNKLGPPRTLGAISSRREKLDVRKSPHPIGSKLEMDAIAQRVASLHGLTVADLKGPNQSRKFFHPRQQAMAEIYATGRFSYPTIGKFFGGRDHTTVISAVKKYRAAQTAQEAA